MSTIPTITYDFDKQEVSWFDRSYIPAMVSSLIGFLIFWVKDDKFKLVVEEREFTVNIHHDGYAGWFATTSNYDGPEDKINSYWSGESREEALDGLIEKLADTIREGRI